MIGWKCRAGVVPHSLQPITPTSLSDIEKYLIDDGIYSIITKYSEDYSILESSSNSKYPFDKATYTFRTVDKYVDFLLSYFKEDYHYLYGTTEMTNMNWVPFNQSTLRERMDAVKFQFSSYNLQFPNIYNAELEIFNRIINGESSVINEIGIVYYIPSLKRVLVTTSCELKKGVYKVDGESLILLNDGRSGNRSFLESNIFGRLTSVKCLKYDGSLESIKNPQNYFFFGAEWDIDSFDSTMKVPKRNYVGLTRYTSSGSISIISDMFSDASKPEYDGGPSNPYEPGGPSGPGGGDGTFDDESDQIVDSSLPTISSANTGFTRIYNPSLSQVQDLARYLWTDSSVIETIWNHIKQFFENPMEAIIGFNLVPVPVPNGGTQNFALMYIDTGVSMTVAASQFVDVDCGTLELKEYYGSALDYSPNTKVSCFLPFIGTVSLNTDEVMGRTLQVKYRVDICSGSCVAKISVDGNFIYQYSGHCAINIPISSADFSSYVTAAISVAKLAGGALAAGAAGVVGAGVADAAQQTNQVVTTTQITNTARNPATGRQITTGTTTRVETREAPMDQSSTQASFSGLTPQNIANTVGQIMTSKPSIEHSGSFSGNSGYLGIRRPFLIIERPNMCMPSNFQTLNGFPSMITLELSTCKGFTRVQQVQLTGLSATNPEQAEILQLLKTGVVL